MTLLVTGAAGFIGFHLCRRLLEDGYEVVGLDNLNDYYEVGLQQSRLALLQEYKGFTFVHASLEDREAMERLFAEHDFSRVIHLAAQAGVRFSIENLHAYIERDVETGIYVAIVPGIPGAHTQAETLDKLQTKLKKVIELCLEEMDPDKKKPCQNLLESSKLK